MGNRQLADISEAEARALRQIADNLVDRQYNADKSDPAAIARREHKALSEQQAMLRMSGVLR